MRDFATKTEVLTTVDADTGLILDRHISKVTKLPKEPDFVKIYTSDISSLFGMSHAEQDALYEFVKHIDYKNVVSANVMVRNKIVSRSSNISSMSYLSKTLKKICEKGVMKKIGTGVYMMNPDLFAKGAWSDIRKLRDRYINLSITYSKNGRIISATINEQK